MSSATCSWGTSTPERSGARPGRSEGGEDALRTHRVYDREEEFAADRYAVQLLDRLPGGPGRGCTDMLVLLEHLDLEMTAPGWSNWLSTHPTPIARLQAVQKECGRSHEPRPPQRRQYPALR
jgi:predicted Zn-dependent protease